MSNLFLILVFAFLFIVFIIALLALSWLITGKKNTKTTIQEYSQLGNPSSTPASTHDLEDQQTTHSSHS